VTHEELITDWDRGTASKSVPKSYGRQKEGRFAGIFFVNGLYKKKR